MKNKFIATTYRFHTKDKNKFLVIGWFRENTIGNNELRVCLDKKKILEAFKNKSYPFATVGKEFRLIEEESISVVVAREEEAEELVRQIHVRGCTREDLRRLQQFCVSVHKDVLDKLSGAGMIRPVLEELGNLYELTAKERYTDEMGLDLEIETGIASFF